MGGEIKVGMSFGFYEATVEDLGKKYKTNPDLECYKKGKESSYEFTKYGSDEIVATAQRTHTGKSKVPLYDNALLQMGSYLWGVSELRNGGDYLNKFDYIQTDNQHSVDLNMNGKVDEGEIFSGKLNSEAYDKAKESGNIANYVDFIS